MSGWSIPLGPALWAVIGSSAFASGFVEMRARSGARYAPLSRPVLFGLGVSVALVALGSPLDAMAADSLTAHMAQHLLLADVAPLLIVLAIHGPLRRFLIPRAGLRALAGSPAVRRVAAFASRPSTAITLWCVVLVGWHMPLGYELSRESSLLHEIEHISYFLAGVLIWGQVVALFKRSTPAEQLTCVHAACAVALGVGLWLLYGDRVVDSVLPAVSESDLHRAGAMMALAQLLMLSACILTIRAQGERTRR